MCSTHRFNSSGNCPVLCLDNRSCVRVHCLVYYDINARISRMPNGNINRVFQKMCCDCNNRYIVDITHHGENGVLVVSKRKCLIDDVFDLTPLPD